MGAIQPWHIALLLLAALILFGSKRLPDAARGLGRSLRIFKSEIKEMQQDGATGNAAAPAKPAPAQQLPPGQPTTVTPAEQPDTRTP